MNYKELIKKVRAVDPEAAEYLDNEARKLKSFAIDGENDTLINCFSWGDSPQGCSFWGDIYDQLLV